jgi:hypothetical protein
LSLVSAIWAELNPPARSGQDGSNWRGTLPEASRASSTALMPILISVINLVVTQSPWMAFAVAATMQK